MIFLKYLFFIFFINGNWKKKGGILFCWKLMMVRIEIILVDDKIYLLSSYYVLGFLLGFKELKIFFIVFRIILKFGIVGVFCYILKLVVSEGKDVKYKGKFR